MSLLSKVFSAVKSVAAPILTTVGTVFGGPVGGAIGGAVGGAIAAKQVAKTSAISGAAVMPGAGVMSAGMFPSLSLTGTGVRAAGGMVVAGAKRVYSAAAGYCRKHPQWCSTIGGIAAVEAMIGRGELPIPKRRRGKGISATELKNFRRVAKFTSQYCAPVRRAMTTKAVRRGARCN